MKLPATLQHWFNGVRLYIAIGIGLVSLQAWWWAEEAFRGDPNLIASRLHEVYGWLALLLLAVTLAVGPVYKLVPSLPGKLIMRDARRLLGIGAAWFATLHVLIAYIISFEAINPTELAQPYNQAFLTGTAALICLWLLAFTSFNAVMKKMGIWWFRLHRLIYAAAALTIWHAFAIGVHANTILSLALIIGTALALFIAHVHVALQQPNRITEWQLLSLAGMFILLIVLGNYGIQQYIDSNSLHGHR